MAVPRVVQLADRLARQIEDRDLAPGDRFLTAAEAAKVLRVSMNLANRALQLLAQRGVIERRRRVGAVVAAPPVGEPPEFARVVVFVPRADVAAEGLLEDGVLVGLQRALPGTAITFSATDRNRDSDALQEMLNGLGRSRDPVGVVLVRSSLAAQRLAVESGLPTVVFGTRRPSVRALDALDRDHRSAGYQLARRVRGRSPRVVVLMNERVLPGDQLFLEGVGDALAEAGSLRPHVRFAPPDAAAVRALVDDLLAGACRGRSRVPVVCRSVPVALAARATLEDAGRAHAIGVADVYRGNEVAGLHSIVPVEDAERQGEGVGELLRRRLRDPSAAPVDRLVAVDLSA